MPWRGVVAPDVSAASSASRFVGIAIAGTAVDGSHGKMTNSRTVSGGVRWFECLSGGFEMLNCRARGIGSA